jgi:SagB-type dehydrogenase family enzyme
MRVKRSSAVVLLLEYDQVIFHNFLAQTTFAANPTAIEIVSSLYNWTELDQLKRRLKDFSGSSVDGAVRQLVDLDVIIVEGSEGARRDEDYLTNWQWGPFAAAYHFSTQGGVFLSDQESEAMLRELAKVSPSPPLYKQNPSGPATVPSPPRPGPGSNVDQGELFRIMAQRRTNRIMLDQAIDFTVVSDCLLFSMAITALLELPGIGELPLKMTPSGGARNPYEAYVLARSVAGLASGVYHYSAIDQSFGLVRAGAPPPFPSLLGKQEWTATGAAVLLLVAHFDRPMWKYHDPAAYRVTAIEAGHIAQNMILTANRHGVVGNPTALLSVAEIEDMLGMRDLNISPMYAVVLGVPEPLDHEDLARVADPA